MAEEKNINLGNSSTTVNATINGKLTANNFQGKIININQTGGTITAAVTTSPYKPNIWKFDSGITAVDGMVISITAPNGGHNYGTFLSVNNGTNYYPIVVNGTYKMTTHYTTGAQLLLAFDSDGSASSMYPVTGAASTTTIKNGVWRVLNYYDSGNTNTDRSGCAYCETAAATAAKVAVFPNFSLVTNQVILLQVTVANTAASALTLNVNSTGAKAIKVNGTATSTSSYSLPVGYYWAKYDGSYWNLTTIKFTDTTYESKSAVSGGTDVSLVTTGEKYTWNNKQNTDTAVTHTASTAVGSATQPVYVNASGVATATTCALNKTVPNDAVFTDNSVTAVGNHYTPTKSTTKSATNGTLTDIANSASGAQVVTGVEMDAAGHVTGVTSIALKATNTANTDRYVNTASFADDSATTAASPVKMTLTRAGSDTTEVTANIPKVSSSSAGVAPKGAAVSTQSQTTKFLREDGTWAAPSYTTDTNTTYTLTQDASDGHKITFTPSSGTATTITIPDNNTWRGIQNNLTSDSTTDSLSAAQGKALKKLIDDLPDPMVFKGSLGTDGTVTTLPNAAAANTGFTYKVITNGTYASQAAKVGDTFISDGTSWVLIPSGDEPSGTVTSVGVSVPTGLSVSETPVTSSGTIAISYANGYAIPTTAKQTEWDGKQSALTAQTAYSAKGSATKVPQITTNSLGQVTSITEVTITDTNTKNTAGSTDTSNKIYLIGATEQSANPQTYSDNEVYVTSGALTTKTTQIGGNTGVILAYDSTNKCLNFNFA